MNRNSGPTGGCLQVTHLNSKAMSGVEKYSSCKKKAGKKWVIYTNINNIGLSQYLLQVTKKDAVSWKHNCKYISTCQQITKYVW